tara:strand:- start:324 stop:1127 length:804 start_codon:yes stop_codon:yes gene_type:complete
MKSKYNQVTFEPSMSVLFRNASGGVDVLWDWQPMEIPKGTCVIKSLAGTIAGVDGAGGNLSDFLIYFATSENGVAPASFGTVHAVNTAAITAAFRRNILGFTQVDMSSASDATALRGNHALGARSQTGGDTVSDGGYNQYTFLSAEETPFAGDAIYPKTTAGYQTIWVAGIALGAVSFSTEVDLDDTDDVDANTTGDSVQITTQGTDPRLVFQPGDLIKGHTGTVTAEVVSVDSATLMTVKNISAQIDDNEELLMQTPISLKFGLEY